MEQIESIIEENRKLKEELQRIYALPELEWLGATAAIMQEFAKISRAGYTKSAKEMVKILDLGTVYVNRTYKNLQWLLNSLLTDSQLDVKMPNGKTVRSLVYKPPTNSVKVNK